HTCCHQVVPVERRREPQSNCRCGYCPWKRYQDFQQTATAELSQHNQICGDEAHHDICCSRDQRHRDAVHDRLPELCLREKAAVVIERVFTRDYLRCPRAVPRE